MTKHAGLALTIDYETADKITVLNLKDAYKYHKQDAEEITARIEAGHGVPEHRKQDLVYNTTLMIHIKAVLAYFGETVE